MQNCPSAVHKIYFGEKGDGGGGTAQFHSQPCHWVWVNGKLLATASLPQAKQPPLRTAQEAEWAPESVWTFWKAKNFSAPPVIEHAFGQSL